jgi:hypothetical protein
MNKLIFGHVWTERHFNLKCFSYRGSHITWWPRGINLTRESWAEVN